MTYSIEAMYTLDEALHKLVRGITLSIDVGIEDDAVARILAAVDAHAGDTEVRLRVQDDGDAFTERRVQRGVKPSLDLLHALVSVLGEKAVDLDLSPVSRLAVERSKRWKKKAEATSQVAA